MFLRWLTLSFFAPLFTLVGNESNKSETDYEIMTYEVTNEEYCAFLNSVGRKNDKYFSPLMSEHFMGGINKLEIEDGTFEYEIIPGFEKKPVIGVSWLNAVKFINWLHYNSSNIENQVSLENFMSYTEGDSINGAYNTSKAIPTRNESAIYWLPNKIEWEKAAFYDGKNWHRDTVYEGSNCYSIIYGWQYPFPHITDVGASSKPSFYGTYDQQGNLAEWIEDGSNDFKLALGGSLFRTKEIARFDVSEGDFPDKSIPSFGFRVCRLSDTKLRRRALLPPPIGTQHIDNEGVRNIDMGFDPNGGVYVKVGYAGNIGDVINQFKGRVNYDYYISKYELTNEEYCNFLNSVASGTDTYNLFDKNMATGVSGGIIREKANNGKFLYYVKPGYKKLPVNYIGFFELARYCNWLHFGCPNGGQVLGITEGNNKIGAYDTSDFENIRNKKKDVYKNFGKRNKGAKYWIPNDDEWYKAAYFDPEKLGNRKYHDYPTRTSDAPTRQQANYLINDSLAIGRPIFLANVDAYEDAESFFGTRQQGGNLWEYTESWQYGIPGNRALRGGSWQYTEFGLNSLNEDPGGLSNKSYLFGGRICKAADSEGYFEIKNPLSYDFYVWIQTRPLKHLFFGTIAIVLFTILIIGFLSVIIYRKKRTKILT